MVFLLFSQWCMLTNTADPLDFIFRKVLCIASVKIVCCDNNIFPRLRDEMRFGGFQLYIWWLNL